MVLDAIAEKEEIQVGEQELIQYLVQSAQQYGMQPNDFIKAISENGQVYSSILTIQTKSL